MKKTVRLDRDRKAFALIACFALMASSLPVYANGWGGNLPSGMVPHMPTHATTGGSLAVNHNAVGFQSNVHLLPGTLPRQSNGTTVQSALVGANSLSAGGPALILDLTSTTATIVLGSGIFQSRHSVTLELEGVKHVFAPGSHVTAAEYVAVLQVLSSGRQSLALDGEGAAVGGRFSLNSLSSGQIDELVVPTGVTALDYASKANILSIAGDVFNYGTISGVAARGQGNLISFAAQEIVNENSGLISTSTAKSMSLSLAATDDITNSGKIVSSGALNLSVGSGNLSNSGLIASRFGNINIETPSAANDINISAAGGTFQALHGSINVRDASYEGAANINLNGGNFLSTSFNLYSGTGAITGNVGQVTGQVNTIAFADNLLVATANLLLGKNNAIDPTFVNDSGNIEIVGVNTFGEDVAIIASGNITANASGQIVDSGHNVTLVAGAVVTSGSADDTATVTGANGSQPYAGSAQNAVSIDTSQTNGGGNIDLTGTKVQNVIDTSNATGNAGNVTLIAIAGAPVSGVSGNGTVTLATGSNINAAAGGSGTGGNVTIIAGNNPVDSFANSIQVGSINTGGGPAGGQGGSISLISAPPTTTNFATSTVITFGTNGTITSGNNFAAGTTSANGNIVANGDLVTAPLGQTGVPASTNGAMGGNITITAGGLITTQNLLAFGGGGSGGDSANMAGGTGGTGGNISVSSTAPNALITINGQVNSSGGGGGGGGTNGSTFGSAGAGGGAGTITISQTGTGGAVSTTGGIFAASGGAGGAGSATGAGGGGAGYGGGGGGGSSGTGGTPGNPGATQGTFGGGAGGAGYFGGGGGDVDGAGGGGGISGGSAGGSAASATAGASSTGGNGIGVGATTPAGGQLSGVPQGGQGSGTGSAGSDIPTATGGNVLELTSNGQPTFGGAIAGSFVAITAGGNLTFPGNVVGTTLVNVTDTTGGSISLATTGLSFLTPSLNINLNSGAYDIGTSGIPIATNAPSITFTGSAGQTFITDSATSATVSAASMSSSTFSVSMTQTGATLTISSLPTSLYTLALNAGPTVNGVPTGTLNLGPSSISVGALGLSGGSVTLTANNLTWTNVLTSDFAISANASSGSGGTISITINQINGSTLLGIGSGSGQLNLSATAASGTSLTNGGSVSLISPGSILTVDVSALQVGYSDASTQGNGGTIILNVGTLINENPGPLVFNTSAAAAGTGGGGNGGTITITTNTSATQAIGSATGDVELIALNGGTGTATQTGGKVSFINQGTGGLTVDPTQIQLVTTTGGVANVNGGSITLTAGTVTSTNVGLTSLALNVDGVGTGNGGKIIITETAGSIASQPATVELGAGAIIPAGGSFVLSAQGGTTGGNGGTVTFSTEGALLLSTDASGNVLGPSNSAAVGPQSTSGSGGFFTISAASFANANAAATSPLIFNDSGTGTGSGGHIRINLLDPNQNLTIGKSSGQIEVVATNGATAPASGPAISGTAIITIANNSTDTGTGQLIVDPTAITLMSTSKTNPNVSGGFIELLAPTIVAASTVSSTKPLILNVSGAGTGAAGALSFEESNADSWPVIGTKPGQFELIAADGTKGGSSGGDILAASGGNLTVNSVAINVRAFGNGRGGILTFSALNDGELANEGNLLVVGSLSVNGSGTGVGGSVGLGSNSTTAFHVGSTKGNTNGVNGSISMSGVTGGSLNISSSGSGGIVIQTVLSSPGLITINANNAVGDVNINSTLGGSKTTELVINAPNTSIIGGTRGKLVTSVSGTTPGLIDLIAATNIEGPTVLIKGVSTTKQLQIVTTKLSATATTGDIDINDAISGTSALAVSSMTAGDSINLSCSGEITAFNGMTAQNTIDLKAVGGIATDPNTLSLTGLAATSAGPIALASSNQGGGGGGGTIGAPGVSLIILRLLAHPQLKTDTEVRSNAVSVFNFWYNMSTKFVGAASTQNASPQLSHLAFSSDATSSTGPLTTFDIQTGQNFFSVSADHGLSISGTGGNATSSLVFQSTLPGGTISGTATLSGKSVQLVTDGGNIGSLGAGMVINSPSLTALTGNTTGTFGTAYINGLKGTTLGITGSQVGSFVLNTPGNVKINGLTTNGGDASVIASGFVTVANVTSSGAINITAGTGAAIGNMSATGNAGDGSIDIQVTSGSLQTSAAAQVFAQNGSIQFENNNVKTGLIVLGAGSEIETGTEPTPGSGGNISISIGAPPTPTATPSQQGLAPSSTLVTASTTGSGVIDWGTHGIAAVVAKNGPKNSVSAVNADVIFSTGTRPSTAIKLDGGVTIVADPPVGSLQTPQPIVSTANSPPTETGSVSNRPQSSPSQPTSMSLIQQNDNVNDGVNKAPMLNSIVQTLLPTRSLTWPGQWSSEAELQDGSITAQFWGDQDLGIDGSVSSALEFSSHEKQHQMNLKTGSVVIASGTPTTVSTSLGEIHIAARSLVLLIATSHSVGVFNLDDRFRGAVSIQSASRTIVLAPGQHALLIQSSEQDFDHLNVAQVFAYRKVSRENNLFLAEFDLRQAIATVPTLRQLLRSKNAQAKNVAAHLVKTMAVLATLSAGREPYRLHAIQSFLASR